MNQWIREVGKYEATSDLPYCENHRGIIEKRLDSWLSIIARKKRLRLSPKIQRHPNAKSAGVFVYQLTLIPQYAITLI